MLWLKLLLVRRPLPDRTALGLILPLLPRSREVLLHRSRLILPQWGRLLRARLHIPRRKLGSRLGLQTRNAPVLLPLPMPVTFPVLPVPVHIMMRYPLIVPRMSHPYPIAVIGPPARRNSPVKGRYMPIVGPA